MPLDHLAHEVDVAPLEALAQAVAGQPALVDLDRLVPGGEVRQARERPVVGFRPAQRAVGAEKVEVLDPVRAEGQFPGGSMTLLNTFPFPGADVPELARLPNIEAIAATAETITLPPRSWESDDGPEVTTPHLQSELFLLLED